ncbi:unnamed protein product [Urochloa decumbens]|uniref:CCHC-type domain-containing protein n=1 Tax=Urochloa decumbens TaxID=240449 RepID=A0ABC8VE19_9POAL
MASAPALDYNPGLIFQGLVRDRYADWTYRFSVSCKSVGIMIHRLRSFSCKSFAIHFTLWRNGGPDSIREKAKFDLEEEAEWQPARRQKAGAIPKPTSGSFASSSKPKRSYAQVASDAAWKTPSDRPSCKTCYGYGHLARACWNQKRKVFRPVARCSPSSTRTPPHPAFNASTCQGFHPNPPHSPSTRKTPNCSSPTSPNPSPSMANFAVDPHPHAPRGFTVVPHDPADPPRRLYAYIGGVMDAYNEDLAIAFFTPAFSPEYQLRLIKHDAGDNVRERDLDREAWLMVMMFPEDARNNTAISKALAGFGLLRYWYDTDNHARIVVKVHLHDDAEIPHDIVVSAGLPPRVRSWTCPVFSLKRTGVTVLGDEDFFPPNGPLHPMPHGPPRWMGPGGSEEAMGPQNAQAEENQGADEEMSAAEHDVHEVDGPVLQTPRKRRARKLKEQLEPPFVRRSRRLNPECDGFRNAASTAAAADNPSVYEVQSEQAVSPAPYLSVENIQGMAVSFLEIQPEAVSAAALLELDNDDA